MNIVERNLFRFDDIKDVLILIDEKASISGEIMKNLEFVQPKIINQLKKEVSSRKLKIGDFVLFEEKNQNYTFLIVRKHYNTRYKEESLNGLFQEIFLKNKKYKTTLEVSSTMKPFLEKILELNKEISLYRTSSWDKRNLGA